MDGYSLNRLAQIEHEQRIRSLPSVPEFGCVIAPTRPGWISRQAEKLFALFHNGLKALRQHFNQRQAILLIDRDQVTN